MAKAIKSIISLAVNAVGDPEPVIVQEVCSEIDLHLPNSTDFLLYSKIGGASAQVPGGNIVTLRAGKIIGSGRENNFSVNDIAVYIASVSGSVSVPQVEKA